MGASGSSTAGITTPTRGWIRSSDVSLTQHSWRALVEVGANRLTVWKGKDVFLQDSVAVGTGGTPTPTGDYYITELLKPTNPGVYGDYAYGLSGHSPALTDFDGYDAEIGLHGTGDPSSIGHSVSHGCVRLNNADVDALVPVLPLGTPVQIQA